MMPAIWNVLPPRDETKSDTFQYTVKIEQKVANKQDVNEENFWYQIFRNE